GWLEVSGIQQQHAYLFLRDQSQTIDLGTLGGKQSYAYAVNDGGTVVGEADLAGSAARHAYLWRDRNGDGQSNPGEMTDLGTLGGVASTASVVTRRGPVVSDSQMTGSGARAAVHYTDGAMIYPHKLLPASSVWQRAQATEIDCTGPMLGAGQYQGQSRA